MKTHSFTEADLFATFRIALGFYLLVHFLYLLPYSAELFSSAGVFPSAAANATDGYFPSILSYVDSPRFVSSLLLGLAVLSTCFMAGFHRRWMSLGIWYGWVCLYHRNNLIHNPSIPYISWLLLACALIPAGEPQVPCSSTAPKWTMPKLIRTSAWILLGVGYSLSGFDKLWNSPSWSNGEAIRLIATTPLARTWAFTKGVATLPSWLSHFLTYTTVGTELLFGPLALWSLARPWIWLAMTGVQIGILFTVDFPDLTLGMLLVHLFVMDWKWLGLTPKAPPPSRLHRRRSA